MCHGVFWNPPCFRLTFLYQALVTKSRRTWQPFPALWYTRFAVRGGYEYMHFFMNPDDVPVEEGQSFPTNTGRNPIDLDEKLLLKKKQVLLLFSNTMVHCKTQQTQMQGYKLHVMIHTPYPEDKSSLPNGVYILKTYTELKDGSRNVSVVFTNLTSKTIHLAPGRCVARVAAANEVPEAMPSPELVKDLEEALPKEAPKLTIEE